MSNNRDELTVIEKGTVRLCDVPQLFDIGEKESPCTIVFDIDERDEEKFLQMLGHIRHQKSVSSET